MATSYKMRMYRRRRFEQRYLIGGIIWGTILFLAVLGLVVWT